LVSNQGLARYEWSLRRPGVFLFHRVQWSDVSMRGLAIATGLALFAAASRADVLTFSPLKDNTLYLSTTGSLSSGQGDGMFVGNNGNADIRRGVIAFDVRAIPPGSTINSVTLAMYMNRTRAGNRAATLHRAVADWGEGASGGTGNGGSGYVAEPGDATWIHRFYETSFWATPGGDFDPVASATTTVGGIGTYTWSGPGMIECLQSWVNFPATNFGWVVRGDESTSVTAKRFATREELTLNQRPLLTVNFTPPPDAGACCFSLGNCSILPASLCAIQGGVFSGIGTSCSPNLCPQPTGGCCLPNLECQVLTQAECTAAAGTYQGNSFPCSPGLCTLPTGACCFATGECQVLRFDQSQNGVYRGDNIPCSSGLCPIVLTPFVDALPRLPVAVPVTGFPGGAATYSIDAREVTRQLHRDLPPTRVWGYSGQYPGPTIEAFRNQPVNVTWINDLRDPVGELRQHHYLPVDMCLHGPMQEGDAPRLVTHLHGVHCEAASDGFPESTILPGEASFAYRYPNTQLPATLWYHDHALGITRLNVHMGLAGFYIMRDAFENGLGLPSGAYEVPLIIQDRSFNPDGSLKYPGQWNEQFFGDFIVVNGKIWPFLNVNRGKYRFRVLNGSSSRTYRLALSNNAPFHQIGTDGGLLPEAVPVTQITVMPGERADIVINFEPYTAGTEITFVNSAPAPFPGAAGVGVIPNVMKFVVQSNTGSNAPLPGTLRPITPLPEALAAIHRDISLQRFPETCPTTKWLAGGLRWDDITDKVHLDTTEVWAFTNRSDVSHPMHLHLIQFLVLDRQDFQIVAGQVVPTGPRLAPPPEEAGWKDTVQCHPAQITRVIARFTEFKGLFAYHCHILEHEDNEMMRQMRTTCYVNCDHSVGSPVLSGNDFLCFLNRFAEGSMYANCDGSAATPVLTANDFLCYINRYSQGCP
jgi:spore coat protein A